MKKLKTVEGYVALVPSTEVPFAGVGSYGRYYEILCDPDAFEQAKRQASLYPEKHQKVVRVTISYLLEV
jgi:hypothetical protein